MLIRLGTMIVKVLWEHIATVNQEMLIEPLKKLNLDCVYWQVLCIKSFTTRVLTIIYPYLMTKDHNTNADLAQLGERQTEENFGRKSGGPVFDPQNSQFFLLIYCYFTI